MTSRKILNEKDKFLKELLKNRKIYTKALQPRCSYTKDYDIFAINWGRRKVEHTIELNLLGSGDLRFDVNKDGTIVGVEIENMSEVLKKFNCDKDGRKRKKE